MHDLDVDIERVGLAGQQAGEGGVGGSLAGVGNQGGAARLFAPDQALHAFVLDDGLDLGIVLPHTHAQGGARHLGRAQVEQFLAIVISQGRPVCSDRFGGRQRRFVRGYGVLAGGRHGHDRQAAVAALVGAHHPGGDDGPAFFAIAVLERHGDRLVVMGFAVERFGQIVHGGAEIGVADEGLCPVLGQGILAAQAEGFERGRIDVEDAAFGVQAPERHGGGGEPLAAPQAGQVVHALAGLGFQFDHGGAGAGDFAGAALDRHRGDADQDLVVRAVIGQHMLKALNRLAAQRARDRQQVGRHHAAVGIGDAPGGAVETQADQLAVLAAQQHVRGLVGEGELAGIVGLDQGDGHGVEHVEHAPFQCIDLALGLEQEVLELPHLKMLQRGDHAADKRQEQQDGGGNAQDRDQITLSLQ